MKKVLIRWNEPRVMSMGTGLPDASVVQIKPGINEVSQEVFEMMKKHPVVSKRFEKTKIDMKRGKVTLLEVIESESTSNDDKKKDNADNDGTTSIEELGAKDAKTLIAETLDYDLLKSWLETETRKTVKEAIEKRIEEFKADMGGDDNSQE